MFYRIGAKSCNTYPTRFETTFTFDPAAMFESLHTTTQKAQNFSGLQIVIISFVACCHFLQVSAFYFACYLLAPPSFEFIELNCIPQQKRHPLLNDLGPANQLKQKRESPMGQTTYTFFYFLLSSWQTVDLFCFVYYVTQNTVIELSLFLRRLLVIRCL